MAISPYKAVWLIALFDLPTDTAQARRAYTGFRNKLLDNGFGMMQYSVYSRYCPNEEKAQLHRRRIKSFLPDDGEVRIMTLTDTQYAKMKIYYGRMRRASESAPGQVEMF